MFRKDDYSKSAPLEYDIAEYSPPQKKRYTVYDSVAIVITFLTAGNGLISLVNGIQWFASGGSLVPHLDAVEVLVGAVLLMFSFGMMMILFTKLKVPFLLYLS